MAQTIKLKRSSVSGNTPSTSDLELGEVAINTYDGKMFIKKNDGSDSIVEIGGTSGTVTEAFKTIAVSGQSNVVADSGTDTLTLVAGSNMTITTNASGDSITFASSGGGGTQNVFTTFAVSGQSNVVADGTTDTLTLVAGSGITLTTDASNDEITITNSATGANAFGNIAVSGQTTVAADSTNDTLTLTAGTGITLTTDATNDGITITNSATGANAFGNIAVSGQSTVAADSTNDTVTFVAGSNMTITTNASGDTVTFASSGSGSQNVFSNIAVSGQGTVQADATTDTLTVVAGTGISLTTDTSADSLTITNTGSVNVANAASSIKEFKYDISSSTTTITGSDANSNTLAYEAEAIQVFLNGILLDPATDYTATNGTSVVLTDAAVSGDDVQIISFNRKIVTANVGIDTFTGNGSTTAYTLSSDPVNENNTRVHIDGVYQEKAAYSVSGTTLTFSAAPPNGSSIEVEVGFTQAEIGSTLDFADNAILRIGTGNDLQILHDASNSIIKDTGTGDLQIAASTLDVKNAALNETMIKAIQDGAVELYHNNNKKLETVTGGVTITGTVTATTFSGDLSGTINTATTGTTQSASDNSTKIATTAYVDTAVTNLVDSAPGTLNTLNELAAALGDDANFSTTITNSLNLKVGRDSATGAASIPAGTTAQRPGSPAAGQFRYNSTLNQFEGYTSSWGAIGGGGTNTFTTDVFTANGSTAAFTLTQAVSSPNDCIVHVDGIYQTPTDAYGVSGTTLTFTATPANGRKIVVYSVKAGVSGNNLNIQTFSGNGSATSFTMNVNPINENNTIIHIDGVYQQKTSYSTSGTTLTFSAAPANGTTIEVATFTQTEINVPVNDTIDTVHIKDDAVTSAKLGGNLVAPGTVTASAGFVGPLTGNVTGNVSGTAATVTGAAQTNITSVGTLTSLTVDTTVLDSYIIRQNTSDGSDNSQLSLAGGGADSDGRGARARLYGNEHSSKGGDVDISTGNIANAQMDLYSTGHFTVDAGGDIILDAGGADIILKDDGTQFGKIYKGGGSDLVIDASIADKDIIFTGTDGSSAITALTLDMSAAGFATFNSGVTTETELYFNTSGTTAGYLYNDSLDFVVRNFTQDKDLIFKGNDGGSVITAMTIDMSEGGRVGIGETTPQGNLHVKSADSGATADGGANELVVEGSGNTGISILSGASSSGAIYFGDSGSAYDGYISYDQTNHKLNFATNSSPKMYIDTSGNVGIGYATPSSFNASANNLVIGSGASGDYTGLTIYSNSNAAGSIHFADSTSGTDSYVGDIYYNHASNFMAFLTNATERIRIDSSGHVGIGSTSPYNSDWGTSSKQLTVSGTNYGVLNLIGTSLPTRYSIGAGDGKLYLAYDDVNQRHNITVAANGKVGIGAANVNPASLLHVDGSNVGSALVTFHQTAGSSSADRGLDVETSSTGTTVQRWLNSGSELARITGAGKFGIGETGPTQLLHITGNDNQLTIDANGSSANSGLFFAEQGSMKWEVYHRGADDTFRIYNYATSSPNLQISAAGAVTKEKQPYVQGRGNAGWSATAGSAQWNLQPHGNTPIVSRDHGNNYSTTNKRFTCPVAGVYLVEASWYIYQTAAASRGSQYVHPAVFKNGSSNWNGGHQPYTIIGQMMNDSGSGAKHYDGVQISFTIYCSASDYLEIYLYSPNSNPQSYENYHYFSYTLLS